MLFLWHGRDNDFFSPLYQKELLKECFPQILMLHRVVQLGQISLGSGQSGAKSFDPCVRGRVSKKIYNHTHTHRHTQVSMEGSRNRSQSLEEVLTPNVSYF